MGRRWDALRVVDTLKTLLREPNGNAQISLLGVDIATIYAGLGEPNEALAWLERAGEGDGKMLNVAIDPALASLQTDSRFQALLKKVGLGT